MAWSGSGPSNLQLNNPMAIGYAPLANSALHACTVRGTTQTIQPVSDVQVSAQVWIVLVDVVHATALWMYLNPILPTAAIRLKQPRSRSSRVWNCRKCNVGCQMSSLVPALCLSPEIAPSCKCTQSASRLVCRLPSWAVEFRYNINAKAHDFAPSY